MLDFNFISNINFSSYFLFCFAETYLTEIKAHAVFFTSAQKYLVFENSHFEEFLSFCLVHFQKIDFQRKVGISKKKHLFIVLLIILE